MLQRETLNQRKHLVRVYFAVPNKYLPMNLLHSFNFIVLEAAHNAFVRTPQDIQQHVGFLNLNHSNSLHGRCEICLL